MKNKLPHVWRTGERTLRFGFGEVISPEIFRVVHSFSGFIISELDYFIEEIVPSYHTVTVFFHKASIVDALKIEELLEKWGVIEIDLKLSSTRQITIPVCYDEPYCEDIARIEIFTGLTQDEIIHLHSNNIYTVYMIGFLPGFPYLGDLDSSLFVPRLDKPRVKVPKGAVGIGGSQTGIYPVESPGGWNIIGRTPLDIFSLQRENPFLLQAGDQLKFSPIDYATFQEIAFEMKYDKEAVCRFIAEVGR